MNLAQLTTLYAAVLRQLLPPGGYDTAPDTVINADITGHAKALAQCEIDAKRILSVVDGVPAELIKEYEKDYGLPAACVAPSSLTLEQRIDAIEQLWFNDDPFCRDYFDAVLLRFGFTVNDLIRYYPMQCTAPCTSPVNTVNMRFKLRLHVQAPLDTALLDCVLKNYFPAYLRFDVVIDS
jgi:uncharacterized protein YmfQ (DUF2313 family)